MQEQLDEAGFFADENDDEDAAKKSGRSIPGGKKVMKILKKTLKKANVIKMAKKSRHKEKESSLTSSQTEASTAYEDSEPLSDPSKPVSPRKEERPSEELPEGKT